MSIWESSPARANEAALASGAVVSGSGAAETSTWTFSGAALLAVVSFETGIWFAVAMPATSAERGKSGLAGADASVVAAGDGLEIAGAG